MIRVLLCLLFTGQLLMGQDTLLMKSGSQHDARYIEIRGNHAIFEVKRSGMGVKFIEQWIALNQIDRIILEDGTVVWANGARTGLEPELQERIATIPFERQPTKTPGEVTVRDLGILLIGVSGILGYINNNAECDPCNGLEDLEDFVDDIKSRANLQYGSLILGALLMLIGDDMILVVPAAE